MADRLKESPSQTAGPYVHIGCTPSCTGINCMGPDLGASMKIGPVVGEEITITGTIYDGNGDALTDALIEIWQADTDGQHHTPGSNSNFTGWGRRACDAETGRFTFDTVKPGPVPFTDDRPQAPHITFWIVARGINLGLHTRMYFEDESAANAADPILSQIEDGGRIQTLFGRKTDAEQYQFDIHLQGDNETIFFDM